MNDDQRGAMFDAWKQKHDMQTIKCNCETPNPSPTDKNICFDCKGEIYKDYLNKIRWIEN